MNICDTCAVNGINENRCKTQSAIFPGREVNYKIGECECCGKRDSIAWNPSFRMPAVFLALVPNPSTVEAEVLEVQEGDKVKKMLVKAKSNRVQPRNGTTQLALIDMAITAHLKEDIQRKKTLKELRSKRKKISAAMDVLDNL